MKRYYISPIVGAGTEADPFRPKVADYGVSWAGVIKSDQSTGRPRLPWCLVVVEADSHAAILADADIQALPALPLDGKVAALGAAVRNRLASDLQSRGIDPAALTSADGYRDVIRGIGRVLEANFDENRFGTV